jgi:hypothetical protein
MQILCKRREKIVRGRRENGRIELPPWVPAIYIPTCPDRLVSPLDAPNAECPENPSEGIPFAFCLDTKGTKNLLSNLTGHLNIPSRHIQK